MPDMSLDCIFHRRSIRQYTAEPVADQDVDTLLGAAMAAPSAMGKKPWEVCVVRDPDVRREIAAVCPYWGPFGRAPLGIVVCGHVSGEGRVEAFTVEDCCAATQNLLLAATALGLGAVWLGCYGVPERVEAVSRLLGLPEGGTLRPISVVAVGHPAETKEPHGAADPSKARYI